MSCCSCSVIDRAGCQHESIYVCEMQNFFILCQSCFCGSMFSAIFMLCYHPADSYQINFYLIYVAGQFKVFRYFRFTSATRPMSLRVTPSTLTHGYTHKCSSMRKWHSYWIN
ncbi:hypothetical protein VCUG_00628 [Vavraia culicis subsp. floridensis]|uniref:Uncharacterized protein n=1 Tax=Vavraia culicis (isolate floridensis) TaxID=948595 RepID=L2GXB5_VAVCU|nr:uncharacterized protein VCUG_00628 [Vavraia culicis subsp. floridensis]ELA47908.1 hypothetical protein VCUG_00628 [Vavraia culicis subsp. floridensis]